MVKIKFKTRVLCAQLLKDNQNYTFSSKYPNVGKIMFLMPHLNVSHLASKFSKKG